MKTVRLITCNDAMQAHILQGALENEGIDSLLHNENFSWLSLKPWGIALKFLFLHHENILFPND
ncbi:MAG: DUF2007 domain-containing protein [Bacteroides nordii]|nr:DUF2007 domain-containing protein [Bacteroides nordii]